MAFPTSSLTNNQVHKEGNRAFVYDSALGVWDQVRETDIADGKNLYGEIGAGATFPAGHVLQIQTSHLKEVWVYTNTTTWDWGTATTRGNQTHGSIIDPLSLTLTAKGTNSDFYLTLLLSQVGNGDADGGFNLAANIYSSADTYANPVDRGNQDGDNRVRVSTGAWLTLGHGEFSGITMNCNLKQTGASIAKGDTISYRVGMSSKYTSGSGNILWINKYNTDADGTYSMRGVNTLQVIEVAT